MATAFSCGWLLTFVMFVIFPTLSCSTGALAGIAGVLSGKEMVAYAKVVQEIYNL